MREFWKTGCDILNILVCAGFDVAAVDIVARDIPQTRGQFITKQIDVTDKATFKGICDDIDVVITMVELTGVSQWIVSCIGNLAVLYIMFSGAKRLETRQTRNFIMNREFQSYVRKTLILIPLLLLHSLLIQNFTKI